MSAPYVPPPAQPPYGYPAVAPYGRVPRRPNVAALVLATLGGAVAIVGGVIDWYDPSVTVAGIVHTVSRGNEHGFASAWFGWLMWIALALTVVGALFAAVPGPLSTPLRVVAPLLAVVTAAATVGALDDLLPDGASFIDHAQAGLWLTLLGPLVAGVAAIPGPRTVPGVHYPPAPPTYAVPH